MGGIIAKLGKLMSVRMLAIGLTFLQTIVITRVFGSEVFGLLSFALSISALLVLVLSAGLDQVLMRDIARIGQDRIARSQRWHDTWGLVIRLVIPTVVVITLSSIGFILNTNSTGPYKYALLAVLLMLPVVLIRKYAEGIALGAKQVVRSITGSQLVYPALMCLGAGYVWYFGIKSNAISIAFTYSVALIGSTVASILMIFSTFRRIKRLNENEQLDEVASKHESPGKCNLLKSGMHFSLISLGFILTQHVDVLIMASFSTPENVGIVRIAARIAEMTALMRSIILMYYKPRLAEAFGKNNTSLLVKNVDSMVSLFVLTGVPLVIFALVFSEELMLVFGREFVTGADALRLFIVGVFVTLVFGPSSTLLSLTDNEKIATRNLIVTLIVQVTLDIILIPKWGVLGCGFANMIALLTLSVLNAFSCKKFLNIDPTIFGMLRRRNS